MLSFQIMFQESEILESELAEKINLIKEMKKKLDDAKKVETQCKSLDHQLKTLSSEKESMVFSLLALEVFFPLTVAV